MNVAKSNALKKELASQAEPQLIRVTRFFDGNDDEASIGCNLAEHPGIGAFRSTFELLERRGDVQATYARISELDPGEDSWPFTDAILVVGTISAEDLSRAVAALSPDEVVPDEANSYPPEVTENGKYPIYVVWWD